MRKTLSIIAIVIGYLGLAAFVTISLAQYYGWASFYGSSSALSVNSFYYSFSQSEWVAEIVTFISIVAILALATISIKLASESKVRKAMAISVELPITSDATYVSETYATAKEADVSVETESEAY